jgi:hypothetical protein
VCLFVGYLKGTRGYLFYSRKEIKLFVTTNEIFLENDNVNNYRPKSKVVLEEMLDARETTSSEVPEDEVVVLDIP